MKTINKFIALAIILIGFNACQNDDDFKFTAQEPTDFVLTNTFLQQYVLPSGSDANENIGVLFAWHPANFDVPSSVSYMVEYSLLGDFSDAMDVPGMSPTSETQMTLSIGQLKAIAAEAGLDNDGNTPEPDSGELFFRIRAFLGDASSTTETYTPTQSINVFLPAAAAGGGSDITISPWGIVGDATQNGWDGPDVPFYTTSENNVIVAFATFTDGQIKFRQNNTWGGDYGDANMDGVLDQDPDNNINVTAGTYKITINWNDNTYTIEEFYWGLVGSATPNGWDGPDTQLQYDFTTDTFKTVVQLSNGDLKFRMNDTWGGDYGDANDDGVLDQDPDNNIAITAGYYLVTANFETLEYSIVPTDIWGAVGSATPNGWDGPDYKFTPDFSNPGVWVLRDINLVEGQMKFRKNDTWGGDYGDANVDGILDQDPDNNINVTAGTYTITLDFSDAANPTYTIE